MPLRVRFLNKIIKIIPILDLIFLDRARIDLKLDSSYEGELNFSKSSINFVTF